MKDATVNFSDTGYVIGSDLRIETGAHLLFLEMGSVGVPLGPWSPHSGGAVQLVIGIGELRSKDLTFTEADTNVVKMINNFAGPLNPKKQLKGTLHVEVSQQGEVKLSGKISLTSEEPSTFQKFTFDNDRVPVMTVRNYLELKYKDDDPVRRQAEEKYKEVLEKSAPQQDGADQNK